MLKIVVIHLVKDYPLDLIFEERLINQESIFEITISPKDLTTCRKIITDYHYVPNIINYSKIQYWGIFVEDLKDILNKIFGLLKLNLVDFKQPPNNHVTLFYGSEHNNIYRQFTNQHEEVIIDKIYCSKECIVFGVKISDQIPYHNTLKPHITLFIKENITAHDAGVLYTNAESIFKYEVGDEMFDYHELTTNGIIYHFRNKIKIKGIIVGYPC